LDLHFQASPLSISCKSCISRSENLVADNCHDSWTVPCLQLRFFNPFHFQVLFSNFAHFKANAAVGGSIRDREISTLPDGKFYREGKIPHVCQKIYK